MNLVGRIRRAAVEAVGAVGLEGIAYHSLYIDPQLAWAFVHFRTLKGETFTVEIRLGGCPEQPVYTTVKALREQIVAALESAQIF